MIVACKYFGEFIDNHQIRQYFKISLPTFCTIATVYFILTNVCCIYEHWRYVFHVFCAHKLGSSDHDSEVDTMDSEGA